MSETPTDPIETLLSRAGPRQRPDPASEAEVRQQLHTEWRQLVRAGRRRRVVLAMAAAVATAAITAAIVNVFDEPDSIAVRVAAIDKSRGSIFFVTDDDGLVRLVGSEAVFAGQVVETGADSGIGLRWPGGASLRIDAGSRVSFDAKDTISLIDGRMYFDSGLAVPASGLRSSLVVRTQHGTVRHIGTQFVVQQDRDGTAVYVREGRVSVSRSTGTDHAVAGQVLQYRGDGHPAVLNAASHGDVWRWAESVAPDANLRDDSLEAFLDWFSRETGLGIRFANPALAEEASAIEHSGLVETEPRVALRQRLATAGLEWGIDGDAVVIRAGE